MGHYLICYDIADPKRLGRIHRRAVKHAIFVQYSVYYLRGDQVKLQALLGEIEPLIDSSEDDVRAYSITSLSDACQMGRSWIPDDIQLI
jgi:CRISPR-associated protein Cas2